MSNIIFTIPELARNFGLDYHVVDRAIKEAKLEPVHVSKYGRGYMRFYAQDAASDVITAYMQANRVPPPEPEQDTQLDMALAELALIKGELARLNELLDSRLSDAEFKLEQLVANAQRNEPAPVAPVAPAEPKAERFRVVIVGLIGPQSSLMQREFANEFDLRFVASSSRKEAARAASHADAVICMNDFVDHGMLDAVRSARPKYLIEHNGGITRLRDALTSLYVNLCDKEPA